MPGGRWLRRVLRVNAISAATLVAYLRGQPVPLGDARLVYQETRFTYKRRFMSYGLFNSAGDEIGAITPGPHHSATLTVGDESLLHYTVDRRGDTVVSTPAGVQLGELRRRFAVVGSRISLRIGASATNSRVVGELMMRGISRATVVASDGRRVASVQRGGRPPGPTVSHLDISTRSSLIPAILVVSSVPALDAMRRSQRRPQLSGGGS
jgi:hypothetical protein